jgi:hypothetical protein
MKLFRNVFEKAFRNVQRNKLNMTRKSLKHVTLRNICMTEKCSEISYKFLNKWRLAQQKIYGE